MMMIAFPTSDEIEEWMNGIMSICLCLLIGFLIPLMLESFLELINDSALVLPRRRPSS